MVNTPAKALAQWVDKTPDAEFLIQPVGDEILTWTRREAYEQAARLASGFLGLGLARGDKVALLSKNCAEWIITDIALSMAGLVSVPIYPTAGTETVGYVMEHSEARAIVIGKVDNPAKVDAAVDPAILRVRMRYADIDSGQSMQALIDDNEPIAEPFEPQERDVMTILYTSGSTGRPKGVVLSYGAYQYAVEMTADVLEVTPKDRVLSYLPLAHITERTVIAGPSIYVGFPMYFSDSLETFMDDLRRARPTAFVSVPRLWVQFQIGVHRSTPPEKLDRLLSIPLINKLVARRVRKRLGLDQCRLIGSGTAPISPETLLWYERIGINIAEGWGMSETAGMSCTNRPFVRARLGTIGAPVPGTEMKISDEGEILIRSPGLFTEYYKQPDLTAECFTDDGFFHTGDKGEWLEDIGAFRITGRVKDQFKSAKGKYVSPVPIEGKLAGNPLIEQVCVMGSGLRAPVAVVVLSAAAKGKDHDDIAKNLADTLHSVNQGLESHEKMSHILVSTDAWTIENELLTPTMKIKREQLEQKYKAAIATPHDSAVNWQP